MAGVSAALTQDQGKKGGSKHLLWSVGSVKVAVGKYLVAMCFQNWTNTPDFKEMCKCLNTHTHPPFRFKS